MKKTVIDVEDVKKMIPQLKNEKVINALFDLLHITDANNLHAAHCEKRGSDFTDSLLTDLDIKLQIDHEERLKNLPQGAFVTVSNHPFGALDGVTIISLFARYRPEYKVMVNQILTHIGAMCDNFIAVDPISPTVKAVSMNGLREAIQHVRRGNPIGFFPAGAVSKITKGFQTNDFEWQPNIIRLIKQFNKPIVPIHFYGHNSIWFYLLRSLTWKLSTLLLPSEIFNKRGTTIHVSIGETIMPQEYAHMTDIHELGNFLRQKSYALHEE